MKAYGIPRNPDVAWPDVADIKLYGLKTSAGGKPYIRNARAKASTRRIWKRKARAEARREIQNSF